MQSDTFQACVQGVTHLRSNYSFPLILFPIPKHSEQNLLFTSIHPAHCQLPQQNQLTGVCSNVNSTLQDKTRHLLAAAFICVYVCGRGVSGDRVGFKIRQTVSPKLHIIRTDPGALIHTSSLPQKQHGFLFNT